jgi:hypothetical protein
MIQNSPGEHFMRQRIVLIVIVLSLLGGAMNCYGQPKGGPIEVVQYIDLLKIPAVQGHLELADFQFDELEKIRLERTAVIGSMLPRVDALPPEDRPKALKEVQERLAEVEKKAYITLLPFQRLRIDQIRFQQLVRANDATAGLTNYRLVESLKLNESQLKEIRAKGDEVNKKLEEALAKLRKEIEAEKEKARAEVLALLTEEQRKQYHAAMGQIVDLSEPKQNFRRPGAAVVSPPK